MVYLQLAGCFLQPATPGYLLRPVGDLGRAYSQEKNDCGYRMYSADGLRAAFASKTLLFIGDSMTRQIVNALLVMMGSHKVPSDKQKYVIPKEGVTPFSPKAFHLGILKAYEHPYSPVKLVFIITRGVEDIVTLLRNSVEYHQPDIVMLNSGLWDVPFDQQKRMDFTRDPFHMWPKAVSRLSGYFAKLGSIVRSIRSKYSREHRDPPVFIWREATSHACDDWGPKLGPRGLPLHDEV
eukprot:gene10281-1857_t